MKLVFFKPDLSTNTPLPLFLEKVQAGFPSPAQDQIETSLDLNEFLIKHPAATYFVRVQGESMKEARIDNGDILIVDRSLEPEEGKVVIATVDGEFTVKRIKKKKEKLFLMPENPDFSPIEIKEGNEVQIWGVVTYVIHAL